MGAPLVTLGLSPNVTSYSRTRSCEKDTFRIIILKSSFLLAELLELVVVAELFLEDLLRLNNDILDPFELRHDLTVLEWCMCMGVLAAHAVKVASSDKGSGTGVLMLVYFGHVSDLPVEAEAASTLQDLPAAEYSD